MKKQVFFILFFMGFALFADPPPTTLFDYSQDDRMALQNGTSSLIMSKDQLRKWDYIATRAIEEKRLNFFEYTRLFTYLYVAQQEALLLSHELKGSLDPLSDKILSFFLTNYAKPELYETDSYSQMLAMIIGTKVFERMERENALPLSISVPTHLQNVFSTGLITAKWIPWMAKPSIAYWPPAPPSPSDPIWKEQISAIKKAQEPMTAEKKQIIYHWAGLGFPWSDDWRSYVNDYLFYHDLTLLQTQQARAAVMLGLYDCCIAYVGCKYHYLVKRPQVYDPSITYIITVPKHPSYPSGHSTESTVTATIMSSFFPADAEYWKAMAKQCCISRIWAGIHYPLDDQAGQFCGKKVAEKILESKY